MTGILDPVDQAVAVAVGLVDIRAAGVFEQIVEPVAVAVGQHHADLFADHTFVILAVQGRDDIVIGGARTDRAVAVSRGR